MRGAWVSGRGCGWEIKNASCRKHGGLVERGVRRRYDICMGGSTDPESMGYDPALARQPANVFQDIASLSASLGNVIGLTQSVFK